jgi:hypothetical protein
MMREIVVSDPIAEAEAATKAKASTADRAPVAAAGIVTPEGHAPILEDGMQRPGLLESVVLVIAVLHTIHEIPATADRKTVVLKNHRNPCWRGGSFLSSQSTRLLRQSPSRSVHAPRLIRSSNLRD